MSLLALFRFRWIFPQRTRRGLGETSEPSDSLFIEQNPQQRPRGTLDTHNLSPTSLHTAKRMNFDEQPRERVFTNWTFSRYVGIALAIVERDL